MKLEEKTLSSREIFKGKVVHLFIDDIELENGKKATREYVKHSGGVTVLAITDENNVVLVRQYRYAQKCVMLEIPAGKLEEGENPRDCGIRELREETGYEAESFEPLGKMVPTPAYVGEVIHIYLARGLIKVGQKLDEDEFLEVLEVPFDKAVQMVMKGEITDAKTQTALLKAAVLFENN